MRVWAFVSLVATILLRSSLGAQAAAIDSKFAPFYLSDEAPEVVLLVGPIDERAALSFRRILKERPNLSLVVLNSPGGLVQMALLIAEEIHERGINTVILRNQECSSACAFIFLAGVQRFADGRLGVHQIYSNQNDSESIQLQISDILETLTRFNTPPPLITRMLRTPSDQMYYFQPHELSKMGIASLTGNVVDRTNDGKLAKQAIPFPAPRQERTKLPISSTAKSGRVRHPRGTAPLLSAADENAQVIVNVTNHSKVHITNLIDGWYHVRVNGTHGYLHNTWVYVDQFVQGEFEKRYVQIKSFRSRSDAIEFATSSNRKLEVFESVNGWYAVTIAAHLSPRKAGETIRALKSSKAAPKDSFITYGNNYVRRICCD